MLTRVKTGLDESRYQRFEGRGLERGAGALLGAALRHALLNRVPGAAVTAVRAEFDGLKTPPEWIRRLQSSLSLVALTLSSRAGSPLFLRLDVPPSTIVTAAELERPGVTVVDPSYEICATRKHRLTLELWLEQGFGMRFGGHARPLPEGAVAVDAFFGPVIRADYYVHHNDGDHLERVVLEVETNGVLTPQAALWKAALHAAPEWDVEIAD